ncbi:MAG: Uma2 family endonuclease [Hamadaea sp.]|uniref:Uma2 family endonuclease n=1 Tax=Hamadaea sp. TaxID=2024425 RepID=UPI001824687A|nr:Uma2 family endonuclease [Hamadaea sp.]NUR71524.1 Uma2 family endonuclease [Hamadaea sp.]NUT23659.1 Uma2 family endonuclease [Hamadaea sp.]
MTSVLEPTRKWEALLEAIQEAQVVSPEEYESLPESRLLELVDGVVRVMTPATRRHQEIVDALKSACRRLCPPNYVVVREQELRIKNDHRRVPDIMIIKAEADNDDRYWFSPADTLLVVEVVSPHTETVDRLHKPAEYAAAGIEHYWRVEPRPSVAIHTHQLGPQGSYAFTGKFVEGDVVAAAGLPWAKVSVADLVG